MAYFGGTATERPWPRVEPYAVVLVLVMLALAAALLYMAFERGFGAPVAEAPRVVEPAPVAGNALVLVPNDTIWPGQRLNRGMFRQEQRSLQGIENKVVTSFEAVEGAYAASILVADAPLLKDHMTQLPPANALTARIPEGHRAVAIPVNAESAVEGWVRPGVRVDVVWTTAQRGKRVVTTIVENAQVLSAERSMERTVNSNGQAAPVPTHVTLLVSARDAQKIQLAKAAGDLSLTLRGDEDESKAGADTITVDRLLRARDIDGEEVAEGTVRMNGREYVLKGGSLVPAEEVRAAEEAAEALR